VIGSLSRDDDQHWSERESRSEHGMVSDLRSFVPLETIFSSRDVGLATSLQPSSANIHVKGHVDYRLS
jgi:hypothetical protein